MNSIPPPHAKGSNRHNSPQPKTRPPKHPTRPTPQKQVETLPAETVQRAALPLERVHDVERGDGLALGVLGVGDCVADDTLEEGLEDAARLLVDHGRDTLDAAAARQTPDRRLRDALDVVAQDLAVALRAALAEAFAAFSAYESRVLGWGCLFVLGYGWIRKGETYVQSL